MLGNILTGYIVPISILFPIFVFLLRYRTADKANSTIFYYLIFAGLVNAIAIFMSNYGIRNLPLLHIYTIVETVFFLVYFRSIFRKTLIKKVLNIAIVILPILFVLNFIFFQSIHEFNTYTRPLEAIIITLVCLYFMYSSEFVEYWLHLSTSWINIGILIYFPTSTIIFILSNYFVFVSSNKQLNSIIWDVHSVLVLAMYLAFAKAFSLITKKVGDGR
ncbi:MAG: hypothetical protein EOO43_10770 [Flavobacterium sp.]|nr:MAG: hypothetical protein EOO43_10770 [Flavobacterium sp.]